MTRLEYDVVFPSHFLRIIVNLGVVAIEEAGGPAVPFRMGRVDMESGETSPPDGRLPDADKGSKKATIQHLRDIFHRMVCFYNLI